MILETERLILREYKEEDFNDLFKMISDPITMQYYPKPYDLNGAKRWLNWSIENYKNGLGWLAITLKENGVFIGDCGITMQNIDGKMLPELGYHIEKNYWRKGYGKEASKKVLEYYFSNDKFEELYSYMTAKNIPSYSLAEAIGMTKIKEYYDSDNGLNYVYRITKKEWFKKAN